MNQDEMINEAQQAFFFIIAQHYPEIKTGDFPPISQLLFDSACREAVQTWLKSNKAATNEENSNEK
jgi:hypothetical protein